jgi:hypothetical protein
MAEFAVFSQYGQIYNRTFLSGNTTTINNGLDVGGYWDLAVAAGQTSPFVFVGGGSFQKITLNGTEWNAFDALTASLSGLGGTDVGSWSGLTPGNYTFTTAPTSLHLTTAGSYVFSYIGGGALDFTNVDITLGSELSDDDVVWYVPTALSITNSVFAGDVVKADNTTGVTIAANGSDTTFTGRILAAGDIDLQAWNGGNLSFESQTGVPAAPAPEPGSALLLFSALAAGGFTRRRLSRS